MHTVELPEDPITSQNLVAMAAKDWGGLWQTEDRQGGRLGLPVEAGLRRGWVAGRLNVEALDHGSRLTYRVDKSDYKVQKPAALVLAVAAGGASITVVAPVFPALWGLVPFGLLLSFGAWFFVVARLRNSGPEEFFEDLARESLAESRPTDREDSPDRE
ncbi:MAG: hypothetical protein AAF657_01615 [Acidobacteriota bacterium]